MYRGWYKGQREFGSAEVPWEFCLAEWNAQFFGDRAFQISEAEKANLRWEAKQFRAGKLWHRWDYPSEVGSTRFDERYPVFAMYLTDNWRAFRTWGVSAISPWEYGHFWKLRDGRGPAPAGARRSTGNSLQRPGFSPDYIDQRYERMDLAYERSDWIATPAARGPDPQQPAAAGLPRRQAGPLHEQGPQLPPWRDGRETDHRHQQLAGDGDLRVRVVLGPAAAHERGQEGDRGSGPAGANSLAFRASGQR